MDCIVRLKTNRDMTTDIESAMLPLKIQELTGIIREKKRMSEIDALYYLYTSRLYERLGDPEAKLWYESGLNLYEALEEEKRAGRRQTPQPAVSQFIVFCIELYRRAHDTDTARTLSLFRDKGVLGFLTDGFETLHSQSAEYILREIETYLKNRKDKR